VNSIARIVSFILHPLFMPSYLFTLLSFTVPLALNPIPVQNHKAFIILIFIMTCALPLLVGAILRTFGMISSFQVVDRKERILPFFMISFVYIGLTFMFFWKSRVDLQDNFLKLMIIIDGLVLISALITLFMKVSIHSVSMWGVIGIIVALNNTNEQGVLFYPILVAIVLAGVVMSSRLLLGAHSLREVMWGSIAGFATSITGMMILF
jgi:hypothetical protein